MKRGSEDTLDPTEEEQTDKTKQSKQRKMNNAEESNPGIPEPPRVVSPNDPALENEDNVEEVQEDKEENKLDQTNSDSAEFSSECHPEEDGFVVRPLSPGFKEQFRLAIEQYRREEELRIEAEYSDEIDFFRSAEYPPNYQKLQPDEKKDSETAVETIQTSDQPESSDRRNSNQEKETKESKDEVVHRTYEDLTPQERSSRAFDEDFGKEPIPLLTPPSEELPENYQPVRRQPRQRTLAELLFQNTLGLPDIDSFYEGFDECCPHYAVIVAHNFRKKEERYNVPADYIDNVAGFTPKKRMDMANIIYSTLNDFSAERETFNLAMNIADRFLTTQKSFRSDKVHALAICAAFLATKFERRVHVGLQHFAAIGLRETFLMENNILKGLNMDIAAPTTPTFILRYLLAVGLEGHESAEELAIFLGDLAVSDYKMLKYKYSLLATAAVYLAQCVYKETAEFPENLAAHSKYTFDQIKPCVDDILDLLAITDNSIRVRPREKYELVPVEIVLRKHKEFRAEIATLENIATGSLGPTFGKAAL